MSIGPVMPSSVSSHPLSSPSPPTCHLSQHQGLFQWVSSSHQVARVSELQLQHQSFQLVWSLCCAKDSQEASLKPQFKSINSLVLNLLYGPTLISIHDYWKNHSLTIWTFVGKVMSLLFKTLSRFVIAILSRNKYLLLLWLQSSFADFGAQGNKICQCFCCFLPCLPWSDETVCHDLHFLNVEF